MFVEKNGRAARTVLENLERAGFGERGEVIRGDVGEVVERLVEGGQVFRLIFADPPYRIPPREIGSILQRLEALLTPYGRLVVEGSEPPVHITERLKGASRRYGGTIVTFLERFQPTMKIAICPGSFDPVTAGHVDIIRRAAAIYDHVVVAVGANLKKRPRLSAEERARLIEKVMSDLENVSVEVMEGLLVNFAREQGARVVVKGLRAGSDFESEFQQAQLNRRLYPEFETVFIMAAAEHSFLSSSAVREIAYYGGSVRGLVPEEILEIVQRLYVREDAQAAAASGDKG